MKRLILAGALLAACLAVPIAASDASPPESAAVAVSAISPFLLLQSIAVQPVAVDTVYEDSAQAKEGWLGGIGELIGAIALLVAGWFGKKFKDKNTGDRSRSP